MRRHQGHGGHRRRHARQLELRRRHAQPAASRSPAARRSSARSPTRARRARSRSSRTSTRTPTPAASTSASTARRSDVAGGPRPGDPELRRPVDMSAALTVPTGNAHAVAEAGSASPATSLAGLRVERLVHEERRPRTSAPTLGDLARARSASPQGDAVVCTFVNTRKGSLTVVKDFTRPVREPRTGSRSASQGTPAQRRRLPNGGSASFGDGRRHRRRSRSTAAPPPRLLARRFVAPATAVPVHELRRRVDTRRAPTDHDSSASSFTPRGTLAGSVDRRRRRADHAARSPTRAAPARIKVVKQVVPAERRSSATRACFDLQVDGATERADAADGDGHERDRDHADRHRTAVGELAGTGTSLADYDAGVACKPTTSAAPSPTSGAGYAVVADARGRARTSPARSPTPASRAA